MGVFLKGFSQWRQSLLLAFVLLVSPGVVFAKCAEFPVLSTIIDRVERLRAIETWEGVAKASLDINALTQNVDRAQLESKLSELTLQQELPMLIDFKDQTATLAQIASYDGPEALHRFMDSPDYRPLFLEARDLLTKACDLAKSGENSEFATKTAPIIESFDLTAYLRAVAPPVSIGQVVSVGMGLFSLACFIIWFRNRRLMRDRRINKRIACEIPARVLLDGRSLVTSIVDISQSGANVHCKEQLVVGTLIDLEFADLNRTANVRWSNEQFAGVAFNRLISESKLQKLVAESGSVIRHPEKEKRRAS